MAKIIQVGAESSAEGKRNEVDQPRQKMPEGTGRRGGSPTVIRDWKWPAAVGYALIVFTFVVLGGWSAVAKLDSAVTAPGIVAEGTGRKSVQHFEGGIVKSILVHEGEHVSEGQILFRLDPTQAEASLELIQKNLDGYLAEEARLIAERDRALTVTWPDELTSRTERQSVKQAIGDQTKQFADRQTSTHGQIDVLQSKIAQLKMAIQGMQVERDATKQQLQTIADELGDVKHLLANQLVEKSKELALEREKDRLEGVIGHSISDEAQAENQIGETQLQIQQVQNKLNEEVARSIVEVRQKIGEAREKIHVAQNVFQRLDVVAPVAGTVQDLKVFTIGGTIKPGDVLLEVIPDHDPLIVQAHVSPNDMDRMWAGLRAEVRFPAFKSSLLPIISGRVESVSRDRLIDESSRQAYFLAQVVVDDIPEKLRDHIMAGMPAELVFPTGERTVLNYLIRPLENRMRGAFTEQ